LLSLLVNFNKENAPRGGGQFLDGIYRQGQTSEEQLAVSDLCLLAAEAGVTEDSPLKVLPWLPRVEQVLFGHWETLTEEQIRCPAGGSTQMGRKSAQPRWKQYNDESGHLQRVAVYRYYCRNQECRQGSFTHLPPGLVPYSPYRTETHFLALQMYAWGCSTYRRTGTAPGVPSMTVY